MNSLTKTLTKAYIPYCAIIAYRDESEIYMERRDINGGNMGAGIPLTEDCIEEMLTCFSKKAKQKEENNIIHGIVPDNVISIDSRKNQRCFIWFRLPEIRPCFFKGLGLEDGIIYAPGMIYKVVGNSLYIYAFKGQQKPTEETDLYAAPFFNVDLSTGKVCLGNAKAVKEEEQTFKNVMKYWEQLFWGSEFTHLGSNQNPTNSNLVYVLRNCIETRTAFPEAELKLMKKHGNNLKLADIL